MSLELRGMFWKNYGTMTIELSTIVTQPQTIYDPNVETILELSMKFLLFIMCSGGNHLKENLSYQRVNLF
jgi:hypothetical protein